MITADTLAARLASHKPLRIPGRRWVMQCGVVILVADHDPDGKSITPSLLMMKRAERKGDPWSGHVSFPGGRKDPTDHGTRAAALRELTEETGLDLSVGLQPIGRLSDRLTREHGRPRPMVVSPYVYRTRRALNLTPSHEAAELWWVPIPHLLEPERRKRMTWRLGRVPLDLPCIDLDRARLWGLSLMMVEELLRAADWQGANQRAPKKKSPAGTVG